MQYFFARIAHGWRNVPRSESVRLSVLGRCSRFLSFTVLSFKTKCRMSNTDPADARADPADARAMPFMKRSIFTADRLNFGRFMSQEIPMANPPLSDEEQSVVARLTDTDLHAIDAAILANSSDRWLKVARVVLWTEESLSHRFPGLSYVFYAQRLIHLAEQGHLESQGNLEYMRFSEVRIPGATAPTYGSKS